ncbi:MAG TPA: hypothetical protein PLO24_08445 [Bacteroidales bacterium]|jgi:hypothetical protein|nr:hypothetical protein [Bacteroidales bacterium]HOS71431.1 hypothetical protein [Bacteroidales bacterium]HQH24917.1 hypothetical protein [Bacteroidales bacterium]HQJ82321.1 hypothetical protein [Bacteroidales bacterium]
MAGGNDVKILDKYIHDVPGGAGIQLGPDGIPFTADDGLRLQSVSPAIGSAPGNRNLGAYQ